MAGYYGWSPKEILEQVYPTDVETYIREGEKAKLEDRLVLLQIVHSGDTKGLFNAMQSQLRAFGGYVDEQFDRTGLENLKSKMQGHGGSQVKIK